MLLAGDEVFAEDAKLVMRQPEHHVGGEPGVVLFPWMGLTVPGHPLGRQKDVEFAVRMSVLGPGRLAGESGHDHGIEDALPPTWHYHGFSFLHYR